MLYLEVNQTQQDIPKLLAPIIGIVVQVNTGFVLRKWNSVEIDGGMCVCVCVCVFVCVCVCVCARVCVC